MDKMWIVYMKTTLSLWLLVRYQQNVDSVYENNTVVVVHTVY